MGSHRGREGFLAAASTRSPVTKPDRPPESNSLAPHERHVGQHRSDKATWSAAVQPVRPQSWVIVVNHKALRNNYFWPPKNHVIPRSAEESTKPLAKARRRKEQWVAPVVFNRGRAAARGKEVGRIAPYNLAKNRLVSFAFFSWITLRCDHLGS